MQLNCGNALNNVYVPVNYVGNGSGLQSAQTSGGNFVCVITDKHDNIYNESQPDHITIYTAAQAGFESTDTTLYANLEYVFYLIGNIYLQGSYKIEFYTDQILTDKITLYINGETYTCIEITFEQ
jgi:hypothetical protein